MNNNADFVDIHYLIKGGLIWFWIWQKFLKNKNNVMDI